MTATRALLTRCGLLLGLLAFYLLLGSQDYHEIDGSDRSAMVYQHEQLGFHVNNHMLYPVNVLLFNRALASVLGHAGSAMVYMDRTQAMNGLAAVASTLLLFEMLLALGAGAARALALALLFAGSHAVMVNGLNANEPMVGMMWACLGLWLAVRGWLSQKAFWYGLCGLVFALAMATYQSMIVGSIPAAVLALVAPRRGGSTGWVLSRTALTHVLAAAAGGVAGIFAIYGVSYQLQGYLGFASKFHHFFQVAAFDAQAFWALGKFVNLPLGMGDALFNALPDGYEGLRWLKAQAGAHPLAVLAAVAAGAVCLLLIVAMLASLLRGDASHPHRQWTALGLLLGLIPLAWWDPLYLKLWLLPLLFLCLWLGLATRISAPWLLAAALLAFGVNSVHAWQAHSQRQAYVQTAIEAAKKIPRGSLVFCDWGAACKMFNALDGNHYEVVLVPSLAMDEREQTLPKISALIAATSAGGRRVYWLGALDGSQSSWDGFVGLRLGVPFSSFAPFRQSSVVEARWPDGLGGSLSLRRQPWPLAGTP